MQSADGVSGVNGLASALIAADPAIESGDELMLFGQFVGDWEITDRRYTLEDGSLKVTRGELHCGWILDGRATQDVWIAHDKETGKLDQKGTTLRFLDTETNVWRSVWVSPMHNTVMEFSGRKVGNEIVLENIDDDGEISRWIFHGIGKNAFSWKAEVSTDGGKSWKIAMEMSIRRIPAASTAD